MQRWNRTKALVACLAFALPACALAGGESMFQSGSRNPFIEIYGVPGPAAARAAPAREWRNTWSFELTNNSMKEWTPDERVLIDGETYRIALDARYGIGEGFDLGLNVPLATHQSGMLDDPIREWHQLFGFSNTRRGYFAPGQLHYAYKLDGEQRVDLTEAGGGLGDVRLSAGWNLSGGGHEVFSLRAGIKLPTGDEDRLLGSGSTDFSLQMGGAATGALSSKSNEVSWSLGVLRLGGGGLLSELRRDWVAVGSIGLEQPLSWEPLQRFSVKLQVDAHGPFYRSDLGAFGGSGLQVLAGGSIAAGASGHLDVAIIEDIIAGVTPDFGLYLAWRSRH